MPNAAGAILPPTPAEQRQRFNQQFLPPGAKDLKLDASQIKGADETENNYFRDLLSLQNRKRVMGIEPATVLNMNPYPLMINSPLFHGLVVPACPYGQPFTSLVIDEPRYEVKQTSSGTSPVDFDPYFLAREFDNQYSDAGGVVVLRGSIKEHPEMVENETIKEMLVESRSRAIATARRLKQEADGEWNTPTKGSRTITDTHRNAAHVLFHARLIKDLPPWISASRDPSTIVEKCPICFVEPAMGAIVCKECQYVLDPAAAFKRGVIKEDSDALIRLTRKQLKELHLTQTHVPETLDERDARLKAAAEEEELEEATKPKKGK